MLTWDTRVLRSADKECRLFEGGGGATIRRLCRADFRGRLLDSVDGDCQGVGGTAEARPANDGDDGDNGVGLAR
jgi:hypothetical protein